MDAISKQEQAIVEHPAEQIHWLEATWRMIETTLTQWTIEDLTVTYRHLY